MANVTIPHQALDDNAQLAGLAQNALLKGATTSSVGDSVTYVIGDDKMPLDAAQLTVSQGGDVTGFPLWIEIADKEANVHASLPNATSVDEEGVETQNTWSTWKRSNHTFYEVEDRIFIGTNANSDEYLSFSNLMSITDDLVKAKDLPKNDELIE